VIVARQGNREKGILAVQVPPLMRAKLFVIVLAALIMIAIAILRSQIIKKPLPTQPGSFDQKPRRR
jgi:hypothetical protein